MDEKRPIDIQRDSAGHIDISLPDDESAISDMFQIGGSLHVVKEKGIYQVKLADEMDPKRKNPKVPNTYQRVLAYGSDNPIVGRTLLTAKNLFDPTHLGESFNHDRALVLTFGALKDLVAMHEMVVSLEEGENRARTSFDGARRRQGGSLGLPSVGDLTPQFKSYIQKAHHVLKALLDIVKLFHGAGAAGGRFEALAKLAEERYGENSRFATFMRAVLPALQFIWNVRTCVEHPKANERILIRDFHLDPESDTVLPPTIEVVHPKTPQAPVSITELMKRCTDDLVFIFEGMIAHLSDTNVRKIPGLEVRVVQFPLDQCPNKNVRINYQILLRDPPPGNPGT